MRKARVVFTAAVIVILLLLSACSSTTQKTEPFGKPWQSTCVIGNFPPEAPSVKDDLYTYYNYDFIKEHQVGGSINRLGSNGDEFANAVIEIINDPSIQSHDINQLRIMYNQAMDSETLKAIGFSEIQPYIDMVDSAKSIEEFNNLLLSEDYPFSPIRTVLEFADNEYCVKILPNLILFDSVYSIGEYYYDSENPDEQASLEYFREEYFKDAVLDYELLSLKREELHELYNLTIGFEKAHAKYLESSDTLSAEQEYGETGARTESALHGFDSACSICSSLPLRQLIQKEKLDKVDTFDVDEQWLEALDSLWTEENLDAIKWIAKILILNETRPYRDRSLYYSISEEWFHSPFPSAEILAFKTCDSVYSFDSLIGRLYADYVLGRECKEKITEITENLILSYKDLISQSTWLSEHARLRIEKKLDNMTLNIIEPAGGFTDFCGLDLLPTEAGGTLWSNYLATKKYVKEQEISKLGKKAVSDIIWTAIAVSSGNAFYDTLGNSIYIFPGIMTKDYYSSDMSDEELLGGIGFIIGHEISHAFDYNGSQFDENCASNPVFDEEDLVRFLDRTQKLAQRYSEIEVCPGLYVDGLLVNSEATADLCSIQAILNYAEQTDGFDYELFFKSVSQAIAEVFTPDFLISRIMNAHSLSNVRINISSQMFDKTYEVYGISEGDAMYLAPDKRVLIWGE